MISAITLADSSLTAASILDPLIRPELERRYAALPAHVRKTVESRARKAAEKKQPA
jgi:ABC-type proline/glycine betaine transport system ATPase subunit